VGWLSTDCVALYTYFRRQKVLLITTAARASHSPNDHISAYPCSCKSTILNSKFLMYSSQCNSRNGDGLRAERWRDRSSSPGNEKTFLFSAVTGKAIGPTQPPSQWVWEFAAGSKRLGREADNWLPSSVETKKMCIYAPTHSIGLLGIMLNLLSTGRNLRGSSQVMLSFIGRFLRSRTERLMYSLRLSCCYAWACLTLRTCS
jgi:hypothetical protein